MRKFGHYQQLGSNLFFIPDALPPQDPQLQMSQELLQAYEKALQALVKLDEMGSKLPSKKRFIKAYALKEALLSSAIENIHTTIIDTLLEQEGYEKQNKNTSLVVSYLQALHVSLDMMQQDRMPLVNRVLLAAHQALMNSSQGASANPGSFRQQVVKVGNLVPAPAQLIPELMKDLEQYINGQVGNEPLLIKAGMAHVQFETIHPFLDGNGRIGRLLIVLMLIQDGLLHDPILYPSLYFKKHHHEYYMRLDRVRTHGDFEGWILFYLQAIAYSAQDAYTRIEKIEALEKQLFLSLPKETAQALLFRLFDYPVFNITHMSNLLNKSYNTVNALVLEFVSLGIVVPLSNQKRNKLYQFKLYLDILEQDL